MVYKKKVKPIYEIGTDVDSYCGKCKLLLSHTIVSLKTERPAKVKCNTCYAKHVFKKSIPGSRARKNTKNEAVLLQEEYESLLENIDSSTFIPYDFSQSFKINDCIEHKLFGKGIIIRILSDHKVEIFFSIGKKILIHERT